MADPKKPSEPDPRPAFGDDDEDSTEYSNPHKDLPFKPEGIPDEDDEATVLVPPTPPKKK